MNNIQLFFTTPIGVFIAVVIGSIALVFFPNLLETKIFGEFERTYAAWQGTVGVAASVVGAMVTVYVANMALKLASATATMSFKDTTRESDELARTICKELKKIDTDLRLSLDEVLRSADKLLKHKAVWLFGASRLIARQPVYEAQLYTDDEMWHKRGLCGEIHDGEEQRIRSLLDETSKRDIKHQNTKYAEAIAERGQEYADFLYGESFTPSSQFDNLLQQLDRHFATTNRIPYSKLRTEYIHRDFEMDLVDFLNSLTRFGESLDLINKSEYLSIVCDMRDGVKKAIDFISTRLDSISVWSQECDFSLDQLFHAKVLSDFVDFELNYFDGEGVTEYQTESRALMFIAGLLSACERTTVRKLFSKYGTYSEIKSLKKLLEFIIEADGKSMIDAFDLRCDDPRSSKEGKVWEPVVLKNYSAHPRFWQILQSVNNGIDSFDVFLGRFKQQIRESDIPDYYDEYPNELILNYHVSYAKGYFIFD